MNEPKKEVHGHVWNCVFVQARRWNLSLWSALPWKTGMVHGTSAVTPWDYTTKVRFASSAISTNALLDEVLFFFYQTARVHEQAWCAVAGLGWTGFLWKEEQGEERGWMDGERELYRRSWGHDRRRTFNDTAGQSVTLPYLVALKYGLSLGRERCAIRLSRRPTP